MMAMFIAWLTSRFLPSEVFVICDDRREPQHVCTSDALVRETLASMNDKHPTIFSVPLR